jgi:DNA-binding response OmpR family regulator
MPNYKVFHQVTEDLFKSRLGGLVPTVLIADDDVDHRELMTFALRRAGHEVTTAVDAESAMVVLLGGGFEAALLDVRMPGESGIDLCRRLRAEPRTALLPIMLISADVNDQQILAALHAGADDYLTKPFHRTELCVRLDNLLLTRVPAASKSVAAAAAAARAALHAVRPAGIITPHQTLRRTA